MPALPATAHPSARDPAARLGTGSARRRHPPCPCTATAETLARDRENRSHSARQSPVLTSRTKRRREWPRPERPAELRRRSVPDGWQQRASHGGAQEGHPWERRRPLRGRGHLQGRDGRAEMLCTTGQSAHTRASGDPGTQPSGARLSVPAQAGHKGGTGPKRFPVVRPLCRSKREGKHEDSVQGREHR